MQGRFDDHLHARRLKHLCFCFALSLDNVAWISQGIGVAFRLAGRCGGRLFEN